MLLVWKGWVWSQLAGARACQWGAHEAMGHSMAQVCMCSSMA